MNSPDDFANGAPVGNGGGAATPTVRRTSNAFGSPGTDSTVRRIDLNELLVQVDPSHGGIGARRAERIRRAANSWRGGPAAVSHRRAVREIVGAVHLSSVLRRAGHASASDAI